MWNECLPHASLLFQSRSSFAIKDNPESVLKLNFIFPFLICLLTPFQLLDSLRSLNISLQNEVKFLQEYMT